MIAWTGWKRWRSIGTLHGIAWYCIDMASHPEGRYVLDPSRGLRLACPSGPTNSIF
jgi:hypothetical protein